MTEDDNDEDVPSPEQQWAYIFNTFGEEKLRQILFGAAADLTQPDEPADRKVLEFTEETALDITKHHEKLEDNLDY